MKFNWRLFLGFIAFAVIIVLGRQVKVRFDFTADRRYSLSDFSKATLKSLKNPIKIDVFLAGRLPAKYLRFHNEIDEFLDAISYESDQITYEFINPFADDVNVQTRIEEMASYGLTPQMVYENKNGNVKETILFPWAVVNNENQSVSVSLLRNNLGDSEDEKLLRSVQQLEYQLIDGIQRATITEKKNIAVLTSHGTSTELKIADFLKGLSPYYNLASFDLKAKDVSIRKSLENLKRFELLIVSNPKMPFSSREKFVFDQYMLDGGNSLWLVDGVNIDRDSLFNDSGMAIGLPNHLNLGDFFFNYGIRLRKELIKDLYCAPIVVAQGKQNNTQYITFPWVYFPLPQAEKSHEISNDVGTVLTQFASPLDTLPNESTKIVLIASSDYTKVQGIPALVQLEEARQKLIPSQFDKSSKPIGVLLKGKMKSLFKNRLPPFKLSNPLTEGNSKLIVVGDGSIAENQTDNGVPLPLGFDKWTGNFYANKTLLTNMVHYLGGNAVALKLRKKKLEIPLLDAYKVEQKGTFWKITSLTLPLVIGIILGLLTQVVRIRNL